MASVDHAAASGADYDAHVLRKRNVPSTSANGGLVDRVEIDEKKTQVKQVRSHCPESGSLMLERFEPSN